MQHSRRKCEEKLKKYHNLLKEIEQKVEDGEIAFTGYAFVTFKFEEDARLVLETIRRPNRLGAVWNKLRHLLCFYVPRSRNPLLGRNVIIQRPEQPQDIVWENLSGKASQFKIRLATGCATLGLLSICFCVIFASVQWKKYLIEEYNIDDDYE